MDHLPIALHPSLTVFLATSGIREPVAQVTALLAIEGPVTVLDGGNCFPAYRILRLIAAQTADPEAAMVRTYVRRAFTCYQMAALLDGTPTLPQPYIVLDPLATFYDDQIPQREVERLLESCLRNVERLSQAGPVLVAMHPPQTPERAFLVERICARADRLYVSEPSEPQALQPTLL